MGLYFILASIWNTYFLPALEGQLLSLRFVDFILNFYQSVMILGQKVQDFMHAFVVILVY